MHEKLVAKIVLIGAGILVGFALLSVILPPVTAQNQINSGGNAITQIPAECGNINDQANIQRLSHHPDQFRRCYRVIDPAKFKAATGQDISDFIR